MYIDDGYSEMSSQMDLKADFVQSEGNLGSSCCISAFCIVKQDHNAQGTHFAVPSR